MEEHFQTSIKSADARLERHFETVANSSLRILRELVDRAESSETYLQLISLSGDESYPVSTLVKVAEVRSTLQSFEESVIIAKSLVSRIDEITKTSPGLAKMFRDELYTRWDDIVKGDVFLLSDCPVEDFESFPEKAKAWEIMHQAIKTFMQTCRRVSNRHEALSEGIRELLDPRKNESLDADATVDLNGKMDSEIIKDLDDKRRAYLAKLPLGQEKDASDKSEEVTAESLTHWGDLSDDEDVKTFDHLVDTHETAEAASASSKVIRVPSDLPETFPLIDAAIKRWAIKKDFKILPDDTVTARANGFRHPGLYTKQDSEFRTAYNKLNALDKQALVTIHKMFALLSIRPDTVAITKTDVATVYVLSLIFQNVRSDDKSKQWSSIALKSGDGGKSLCKARFYHPFATGSSYSDMLWNVFHMMLNYQLKHNLKDDEAKDMVNSFAKHGFTSPSGMLANTYRVVSKTEKERVEVSDSKGKKRYEYKEVRRTGKFVPKISLVKAPLTVREMEALHPIVTEFNKIEQVLDKVVAKCNTLDCEFIAAMAAKTVSDLAYSKSGTFRKIVKSRKDAIRRRITATDKNAKVTQESWLLASNSLLSEIKEVDVSTLNLVWSVDDLVAKVSALVNEFNSPS